MDAFKILLITFTALLAFNTLKDVHAANYGDDCPTDVNHNESCPTDNIENPLLCLNEVCQCHPEMTWHRGLSRCVSPEGALCTVKSGDGKPIWTCTEFAQCFHTTRADRVSGTCHCDPDAKKDDASGECKLSHGSLRCKQATDCKNSDLLTCSEGKCVCASDDLIHNGDKCVGLVGSSCAAKAPFPAPGCEANQRCDDETKKCVCNDGFTATPDKTCGRPHGGNCDKDSDCHPQFTCQADTENNKKCACPSGQQWDGDNSRCFLLVGSRCNATEGSLQCAIHASCQDGECKCTTGYQAGSNNETGKCIGLYGSDCPTGTSCNEADYLKCNDDKKCTCIDNYEGNDNAKKCQGLIEQNCRNNDDCITSQCGNDNKCGCGAEQVPADDKKSCLALYGGTCGNEVKCDNRKFLDCLEGTCNCSNVDDMLYREDKTSCVSKAEKPCGPSAGNIECVENAACNNDACVCLSSFRPEPSTGECTIGGSSALSSSMLLVAGIIMFLTKM